MRATTYKTSFFSRIFLICDNNDFYFFACQRHGLLDTQRFLIRIKIKNKGFYRKLTNPTKTVYATIHIHFGVQK